MTFEPTTTPDTRCAGVAQLAEQRFRNAKVRGSTPRVGTRRPEPMTARAATAAQCAHADHGDVAQFGRAPGLHPGGRGFEARRFHNEPRRRRAAAHRAPATPRAPEAQLDEHPATNRTAAGSNPARGSNEVMNDDPHIHISAEAQMVEHRPDMSEVVGSSPTSATRDEAERALRARLLLRVRSSSSRSCS